MSGFSGSLKPSLWTLASNETCRAITHPTWGMAPATDSRIPLVERDSEFRQALLGSLARARSSCSRVVGRPSSREPASRVAVEPFAARPQGDPAPNVRSVRGGVPQVPRVASRARRAGRRAASAECHSTDRVVNGRKRRSSPRSRRPSRGGLSRERGERCCTPPDETTCSTSYPRTRSAACRGRYRAAVARARGARLARTGFSLGSRPSYRRGATRWRERFVPSVALKLHLEIASARRAGRSSTQNLRLRRQQRPAALLLRLAPRVRTSRAAVEAEHG